MKLNTWNRIEEANAWTGQTSVRHIREFSAHDNLRYIYAEVYVIDNRVHWVSNVYVEYRPDLSRLSCGWYANVPGALSVAKMRASRAALAAIRKVEKPRY